MTIAITLKVTDGVVIASDSATIIGEGATGNVYNHAEKVFNLVDGARVGCVISGRGDMMGATMSMHVKDLIHAFDHDDRWRVDRRSFTVESVARKLVRYLVDERYVPWCEESPNFPREEWPGFGILIAGYSAGSSTAEIWRLNVHAGQAVLTNDSSAQKPGGIHWAGNAEAIIRLVLGFDARIVPGLAAELGIDEERALAALQKAGAPLQAQIAPSFMPIQDAVELAQFLAETSVEYSQYTPGHQTIGGSIDIAAITKHEGFKWVRRKQFFDPALNPQRAEEHVRRQWRSRLRR